MKVHVRSPCRLHFGLFSFGRAAGSQYGGVGVMIEPPAVDVTIRPAEAFSVTGSLSHRAEKFALAVIERWKLGSLPPCHIEVSCPPDHTGLGVGTQLALSVAAGVRRFAQLPDLAAEELAASVGRGTRSAIGTYGFQHGGLIIDAGKHPGEQLGSLARRAPLPNEWRFVLVRSADHRGLAGASEAAAFDELPPVPAPVTRELWQITNEAMLPAVEREDCAAFGEAVYQFGRLAGHCFAAVQSGPFASLTIEQLVESIRAYGVPGVGQSSWGPTVFAIVPNEEVAQTLVDWLREVCGIASDAIVVARPNHTGAQISAV